MKKPKWVIVKVVIFVVFVVLALICGGVGVYVWLCPIVGGIVVNTLCGAAAVIAGGFYISYSLKALRSAKR